MTTCLQIHPLNDEQIEAIPGIGKASEVLLENPLHITGNVIGKLVPGDVARDGWRVWSYEAETDLWRLATAEIFPDVDSAQAFGADCVGVVVLRADAVPERCDVASYQAVRQAVNA